MIHRPDDMTVFESILETNTDVYYSERWHPIAVSSFESELKSGALYGMSKEVRKNIAYALQYLEYIQLQFEEIHLHDIIAMHLIKNYIITAMGIIEAIFHHLVVSGGYQKKESWEDAAKPVHTNIFFEDGVKKKYVISVEKELNTPRDVQMDFEYLINKVQEKKLLSMSSKAYPQIKRLKRLRNKVHLHLVRHENDTDYMGISFDDYLLVRYILLIVLRDKKFSPKQKTFFAFLQLDEKQLKRLAEYLKKDQEDSGNG